MPRATKAETSAPTGPRLVKSVEKSTAKSTHTKSSSTLSPESLHDLITKRAYELYLQDGSVHGRDVEHWLRAEQELTAAAAPVKKTPARSTRTAS